MEAKLIIIQLPSSLPLDRGKTETYPKIDPIAPALTVFSISTAIAVSTCVYIFKGWQREQSIQAKDRIICDGCRYFNHNNYLQCALQPKTVMTAQSIDCLDYSPVHQVKRVEKVSKVLLAIRKVFSS